MNPNTSDLGGRSSCQTGWKRKRQRGKAEKEATGRGGREESDEDNGGMEGMETHASKSRFGERSVSLGGSPSANEQTVTAERQAGNSNSQYNDETGVRGEGERYAGISGRSSGEENGICHDSLRLERGQNEKDDMVTEEGGGGCGSGASAESDIGELRKARKRQGPSRRRGPVSKGCIDSRVSALLYVRLLVSALSK